MTKSAFPEACSSLMIFIDIFKRQDDEQSLW
jgi:hypothetical protein